MAGATSILKLPPAFIFFFLPLRFLLNFLIVSFFLSLILVTLPGDRFPPLLELLLTLEICELRTVLTDLERGLLDGLPPRGVLRFLPHSRGVESSLRRALQDLPYLQLPASQ